MTEERPSVSPKKSRDDAKRETRDALIAAGISAFSEEGLDSPSLDSICARAGYTRGAFYVHFKDRDDFLIAVMSYALEGFIDAMVATGDAAFDLQKTIDAFVGAVQGGIFPIKGGVHFHQLMAACVRSPDIRERYVAVLELAVKRVSTVVEEGQGAGTVRTDVNPRSIALLLVAITLGAQVAIEAQYPFGDRLGAAARDLSTVLKPG
jgi:TetR/AcrR family transcriptional regulator, transcriptional repressor for nem operon